MQIIKSNDIYSVDSISLQDIIYGKAMLNKASTVGTIVNVSAIFTGYPLEQPLDLENFNESFKGGEKITTPEELANFIVKLQDDFTYSLDRLDDFLTHYVNSYLYYNMKSTLTIESVFTDIEDLVKMPQVANTLGMKRMVTFFSKLFSINYNNRVRLREILEEEKEVDEQIGRIIYPVPVLIINPVCGLIGFSKTNDASMTRFRNFLDSNEISKVVCQNDSFYPILEDIRNASNEFNDLGYITIVHRTLDDMKYGLITNKVYHRDDGTYYLTK